MTSIDAHISNPDSSAMALAISNDLNRLFLTIRSYFTHFFIFCLLQKYKLIVCENSFLYACFNDH